MNPHAELAKDLGFPPEAGPGLYDALWEIALDTMPDKFWEDQLKKESTALKETNNPPPSAN